MLIVNEFLYCLGEKREKAVSSDAPLQGLAKRRRISHIKVADSKSSLFQTVVRSCPNIEVFSMDNTEKYVAENALTYEDVIAFHYVSCTHL